MKSFEQSLPSNVVPFVRRCGDGDSGGIMIDCMRPLPGSEYADFGSTLETMIRRLETALDRADRIVRSVGDVDSRARLARKIEKARFDLLSARHIAALLEGMRNTFSSEHS